MGAMTRNMAKPFAKGFDHYLVKQATFKQMEPLISATEG
jgi:hypothetical protein